ncbi:MAG: hypothetical protein ABSC19_07115 [Syntrophorhabdales bacterium]|jgi:hypothetical protein
MKEKNTEALQWFVDFANLGLDHIKPGDKAKLLVEADEYLWPREELKQYEEAIRLFHIPEETRRVGPLAWALGPPPSKRSEEYWASILDLQTMTGALLAAVSVDATEGNPFVLYPTALGETIWWVTKESETGFALKTLPAAKDQRAYVWMKILMLLDGLPQHAIRECPGCNNFFFNPTKREKRFCGNRCMWRITTAERREADRGGYNEYQRGLMSDKRREKAGLSRKRTKARKTNKEN